jgi:putative phosphotransacetylase
MIIKTGISARHVHLNHDDIKILFGNDYQLTKKNDLTQPGEYSCNETVTIKGLKNKFDNVRVLGPLRNYTQVEISKTDSYFLGINPPIRNSGDLIDAEEVTIIGPLGNITKNCCIIATRHIHIKNEELAKYGLENNQIVKAIISGEKGGIINNIYIKASDNYELELHIDLDDANSHLVNSGDTVEIEKESM